MIQMARHFEAELRSQSSAIEVYDDVIERYDGTIHAGTALLRKAKLLLELGRFDDGYDTIQGFLAEYENDNRIVVALFMSASCESSMGFEEDAMTHMEEIANDYAMTDYAPLALFFLGIFPYSC